MSGTIALKVEGIPELRAQFALLKDTTQRAVIRRALAAGAAPVQAEAERLAPYDSTSAGPHLKDNIITKVRVTAQEQSVSIGFDKNTYHGQFQELGTVRHAPQPFMRPAIDTKQGEAIEAVADVLRDNIEKAVRRKRSLR